jgi:nicotinamidase-related amidase
VVSALLILDMINLFDFEGGKALAKHARRIAPRIDALRKAYTQSGSPVIYVNDNFMDWNRDFNELVAVCSHATAAGSAIAEILRPGGTDYYILKPKHSAFLCTALPAILTQLAVTHLVLTGIATDSCVLMTAQDAHTRQYEVRVPHDCVAAQTPTRSTRALNLMADAMDVDTSSSLRIRRSMR